MRFLYPADGTAKTGQSLIASSIFQDLPEAPKVVEEEMEVEPTPVAEAETKEDAEVKEGETEEKDKKAKKTVVQPPKYIAPIDPITGDLSPECTVYLRLLLILANLDAARVQQVSRRVLARKARLGSADARLENSRTRRWRSSSRQTGGRWIRSLRKSTSTLPEHTSCKADSPSFSRECTRNVPSDCRPKPR